MSSAEEIKFQRQLELHPTLQKLVNAGDDFVESHDGREEALLEHLKSHPRVAEMRTNPTLILNLMDEFASKQDFLINVGQDKAAIMAEQIAAWKPSIIVELGGYVGYSAILFAVEARKAAAADPKASAPHVWSLEFEPRFAAIMREIFELAGLSDAITVVVGAAADSLRQLKESSKLDHVDYFFLDHVEDLYEADFKLAVELGLLKKGAHIVADNVVRPGAPQYREYVRSCKEFKSEGVPGLIYPGAFEDEFEVTTVL